MTRYICGYVEGSQKPESLRSFAAYCPDVEYLNFTGNDVAYWNAILERWTGEDDLVVFEQDIEITADVLPSFDGCSEPWCTFAYACVFFNPFAKETDKEPVGTWTEDSLGCTKFSAEVQRRVQLTMPFADLLGSSAGHHWMYLDRHISTTMAFYHIKPHVHGRVDHHHAYARDDFKAAFEALKAGPS